MTWKRLIAASLLSTLIDVRTISAEPNDSGDYQWNLPKGFPQPFVPADNPMTAAKVELGRYLFYDTRMSVNGKESCASCHKQEFAFTDGRAVAQGTTGELHSRSAIQSGECGIQRCAHLEQSRDEEPGEAGLGPNVWRTSIELGLREGDGFLHCCVSDPKYRSLFERAPSQATPIPLRFPT